MTTRDPADFTAEDLNDPNVSAETLQQIAAKRKDLWPSIQRHPNSYQGLNDWISAQQSAHQPAAPAAQVTESAAQVAEPAAHETTDPLDAIKQAADKAKHGTKSAIASAKDAIHQATAPATDAAAGAAVAKPKFDVNEILKQPASLPKWVHWARVITPAAALLGAIAMLIPMNRLIGSLVSHSFFTWLAFFGFLAVIALWVVEYVFKAAWPDRIIGWVAEVTAILGLVFGGSLVLAGVGHFGAWLLALSAIAVLVGAHAFFWPSKHEAQ